jgi:ribosomal protein S18 acetylase RimI-like enzyme
MTITDSAAHAITVRDATEDDAAFLAWASLTAARSHLARGIWEVFLGWDESDSLRFVRRVVTSRTEHWVHWSQFLVAEVDGRPAAALSAFDPATHGFEAYLEVATEVAQQLMTEEEQSVAWARAEVIANCLSEEPVGTWIIESVATRPEYRRRGLADALLTSALARGRARGFSQAQISILIGNDTARACYVKHGFAGVDERRSLDFEALLGSPGTERMQRPL